MERASLVEDPAVRIWQRKTAYFLHKLSTRAVVTALIIADISIVIVQLSTEDTILSLDIASLCFSCVFIIETVLRIFSKGPVRYFTRVFCVFEFLVILVTFALSISTIVLYEDSLDGTSTVEYLRLITAILRVFRILKMLRVFRFFTEWVNLLRTSRYTTSQNKRRYIADGFDLDLCYISNQIIAMSFPSSGITALYRNPIRKVAEFLNYKHPNKYLVINMCSEKGYNPAAFNGNVRRFMVDDHYPPFFSELIKVVQAMIEHVNKSPDHVVAVHCRGGKGRTGTVICALLLKQGYFEDTSESLEYFAGQRTDLEVGRKFQGVETPSQARYLRYFEQYLADQEQIPPVRYVKITQFRIKNLLKIKRTVLRDLSVRIYRGRQELSYANVFFKIGCRVWVDEMEDVITIKLNEPPTVHDDVKVVFFCKQLPTHYWRSAFYYLFHTGFLPKEMTESGEGTLVLTRAELDNPHKLAKFYGDQFCVETIYCDVPVPEQ